MVTPVRTLPIVVTGIAGLIGLLAVVNPALGAGGALLIALGTLMLVDIRVGICLFAFSAPLLDGVAGIGVSADKIVGGALALSWIASLVVRPSLRDEIAAHAPVFLALLGLLGARYTATVLWAEDPGEAQYQLIRLYPNLLIVPIAVSAVNDAKTLRWLVGAFLLGVLAAAVFGLITGQNNQGRLEGGQLDPNALALWLIMAAALAYGILAGPVDIGLRALTVIGLGLGGLAILATGSRGGIIGLAAAFVATPLLVRGRHRLAAFVCVLVAAGGGALYGFSFAPEPVRERLTTDVDTGSGRTSIWKVGVRMIEDKPLGGVGGGNFHISSIHYLFDAGELPETRYFVEDPVGAHNTFMQVTAETGLVGGLLFLGLFGSAVFYSLRAARRFARARMPEYEVLARGVAIAFVGVTVGALSISVENAKPWWLLISLGPIVHKLAREHAP